MFRSLAVALSLPIAVLATGSAQQSRRVPPGAPQTERPTLRRPVAPVDPAVGGDLELSAECSLQSPGVTQLVARWSPERVDRRGGDRRRVRSQRLDVTVHKGGFERGLAATLWPVRQGQRLRPLRPSELPPRFFRSTLALRARSLEGEDGRVRLELEAPQTGLNYFVRVLDFEAGEWVPGPTRHVGIPTCISEEPEEEQRDPTRRDRRSSEAPRPGPAARSAGPGAPDLRPATTTPLANIDFQLFQYSTVSTSVTEINPDAGTPNPTSTGGRINRLASDAAGSRWFAASEWGGLYRSTDGGVHWDRLDDHRPQATWDVAVDPLDPLKVYATSFFDGRASSRAGISVSTDGGDTWQRPATATPPEGFCDPARAAQPSAFGIAIDPDDHQTVWIGTNCGVALSLDAGATWDFIDPTPNDPPDGVWDVAVHNGLVDTLGFDGQLRSADGGATWQSPSGFAVPSGSAGQIEVSPDEDHVLYAAVGLRLWESVDDGASWSAIDPPGKNQGRVPFVRLNDRAGPDYDLWYGDVKLVRTSCTTPANPAPGGPSRCNYQPGAWQTELDDKAHPDVGDIAFDPTAGVDACPVLFANDGGVHRNTDTVSPGCQNPSWENPARSPHALWLFALKASTFANTQESYDTLLMGTQDNGGLVSFDPDETAPSWERRLGGDVFDIVPREGGFVVAQCCKSGGAKLLLTTSTLTGAAQIANYPPGAASGFAYGDIIDRVGVSGHVMATSDGVWLTTDIAQSPVQWTAVGAPSFPVASVPFRKLRVRGSGGATRIYLQLGGNYGHTADEVWRYDASGTGGTWEQVQPPGGSGGFSVFEASYADADRIVACHLDPVQGPAMVRSGDGGATWEPLPDLDALMTENGAVLYQNLHGPAALKSLTGYPQPTFVQFLTLSTVMAGSADSGLFVSADAGATWERVRNPLSFLNPTPHLSRPRVADRRFRFATSLTDHYYFYVGTRGRGVFRIAASVPRGPILDICELYPRICFPIERVPPFQFILRPRTPRDVFAGPLREHCPAEGCPAFPGRGDAPAFVTLFLDGLSADDWEVRLYGPEGTVAGHGVYRTRSGIALSFRPDADTWRRAGLGRYGLGLTALPEREGGAAVFTSRLVVSDEPFVPDSPDGVVF